MPKTHRVHGKRAMLNLPGFESTASIVAEVTNTAALDRGHPHINFALSDCTRTVNLDFSMHDEEAYENTLHKLDTIIEATKALRKGIVVERRRLIARQEKADSGLW